MASWSIHEVPVPESVDAPGAGPLLALTDVANRVIAHEWGNHDYDRTPQEVLGALRDQAYVRKPRFLVTDDDGTPLAYLAMLLPLQENTHTAYVEIGVLPEHRRQGIGSALHDHALDVARAAGRRVLTGSTDQRHEPAEGDGTLVPSTGTGRVAADDPNVRFVASRGWKLEQVARRSVLPVPVDPDVLAAHRAQAQAFAGDEYRIVHWGSAAPDEWVDEYATLNTRMSTDVPLGGLDYEEDVWDAKRIRTTEAQFVDRGIELVVAAAEHVPTHTLAAYTVLMLPPENEEFVHQEDTLVLKEHRGRRLGMLVKAANLQRLAEVRPGARRVATWNAEENSYMLRINVDLGFAPSGGAGEWQLRLE
ncbi:GNAT family N-acetyltransferase [Cellulomonas fimi]|uniref:GNAT family N-acetyltransferase n=1 Tax=Cellulomonas fimi TaxID=1708 RepID=UPI00234CC91F|nr:GNAT family N-acetyltransferase [Cellulomonas fimi]MDC7123738.1 GNAT family N-acetyltransferase [Cellulomonas fimi]